LLASLDYVGAQRDAQGEDARDYRDAVSLVEFNDLAQVTFVLQPSTNELYDKLVRRISGAEPSSHGNYLPALKAAEELLEPDALNADCTAVLMFLSDGRPSDAATCYGMSRESRDKLEEILASKVEALRPSARVRRDRAWRSERGLFCPAPHGCGRGRGRR
jgi:hypothetical protein